MTLRTAAIKTGVTCALALSLPALAYEPFSYTYLEARYFEHTVEADVGLSNDKIEGDGWGVGGSYRTEGGVVFQAHYADGDIDKAFGVKLSRTPFSADMKSMGIGIGGANQMNERTSVHAGVGYAREEYKGRLTGVGSEKLRADIYNIGVGARFWVIPRVELNGDVAFVHARLKEYSEKDNDVVGRIGLRFHPVSMVSLGASYQRAIDSDAEIVSVDVRLQF